MNTNIAELELTEGTKQLPFTGYKAAKVVNAVLEAEGLEANVPPQMMYNYTKARINKGKKPLIGYNEETGIETESFRTWLETYVTKRLAKVVVEA